MAAAPTVSSTTALPTTAGTTNPWHGAFPHPFPGFRGWWGYGWYGPVFWPFAYDVIFADLFWPWYYDYPFWAYGYPDIYGALFWPYGYDDLAGYLPPGPGPVAGTYGGTSGSVAGARASAPSTRIARAAASRQAEVTGQISQSCGEDSKEVAGWPIDRIEQAVTPTADQRALLDDFANASIRAAQAIKEACPTTIAFAPTGRLDAMQKRIAGMVQAIDIVAPPLDKFYASLTDEQKARLNAATDQTGKNRSLANCGAVSSATQWPGERIEKAVRPDAQQQAKLDALKTAMADAADQLSKACPSSLPATPPARLSGDLDAARHHAGVGQERPRRARRLLQLAQRRAEGAVQPDRPPAAARAEAELNFVSIRRRPAPRGAGRFFCDVISGARACANPETRQRVARPNWIPGFRLRRLRNDGRVGARLAPRSDGCACGRARRRSASSRA